MIQASSSNVPHQTAFTNGAFASVADVPVEKGGAGRGFGPHELLEAAFATCLTMTAKMSAAKHGFPLTGARCEVRIDRSVPDAVVLNYDLVLEGSLTEEQSTVIRNAASCCPVAKTLTGAISLRPVETNVEPT